MKTIYLDSNFMCHIENANERQPIKTDFFDEMCAGAIECYRYIPVGQSWNRPDGKIVFGLLIQAVKDFVDIQRQYNFDEAKRLSNLNIPQEQGFIATQNYSIGNFLAVYGNIYEVIQTIPMYTSINNNNTILTTVEHYLDTLKEEKQ